MWWFSGCHHFPLALPVFFYCLSALMLSATDGFEDLDLNDEIGQTLHTALVGQSVRCMWYSTYRYSESPPNAASENNASAQCTFHLVKPDNSTSTTYVATGSTYSYNSSAGGFSGQLHDVILPDVVPSFKDLSGGADGWKLTYQCSDAASAKPSTPRSIKLFSSGVHGNNTAIALVADMGVLESGDTMASLKSALENPDFHMAMLVHVGDISYADDRLHTINSVIWNEFMSKLQPFPQLALYMTGPGNHEAQFNFTAYHNWFHMPHAESHSPSPDYYSFDYLGVHFTMISTEMDFQPGSPQYEWLEADLTNANKNREQVPWLVVTGHRPLYCSSVMSHERCQKEAPLYRRYIEKLLYDQRADVYVCGHNHQYERTYPMFDGKALAHDYIDPQAPVYIVNGAAGNIEGNDRSYLPAAVVPWRAAHGTHHTGWMSMVPSRRKLSFFYTQSKGNSVVDQFEIVRKNVPGED